MVRKNPQQQQPPQEPYPAEKARGGIIILRTRTQRVIFAVGLAGAVLLALALSLTA